ncbi:MarR family transcriptional regulator [Brevibacillus formosus]|uniref:MarR family winged helix-turn-helix transcriptional regulator n=1 Tax=Brevibacillus formosus TaxID=54913 RepID=UPI001C66ED55|nr:MarR family transcriptional regulator [Brevibacillus formosus]MBW5469067.1 MarR family transcriptional regulator [Brevibacillus formosus]
MNNDEFLQLKNQLCFTVYALSREITRMYRPYLEEMGVTYPQYLVLLVLWEYGERTVKELGEQLYLDSGTLTPLLKRMQESKLVTRDRSKEDERVVVIRLTEKGHSLKEQSCKLPEALLNNSRLDPKEFSELLQSSQHLLTHIHHSNEAVNSKR